MTQLQDIFTIVGGFSICVIFLAVAVIVVAIAIKWVKELFE